MKSPCKLLVVTSDGEWEDRFAYGFTVDNALRRFKSIVESIQDNIDYLELCIERCKTDTQPNFLEGTTKESYEKHKVTQVDELIWFKSIIKSLEKLDR